LLAFALGIVGSSTEFRILGPFEVVEQGHALALGGPRQRAVLAMLLLQRGQVVTTDQLVDQLWDERPPLAAFVRLH
jgi:DNA-binding SARP family transcriptional activator